MLLYIIPGCLVVDSTMLLIIGYIALQPSGLIEYIEVYRLVYGVHRYMHQGSMRMVFAKQFLPDFDVIGVERQAGVGS